MLRALLTSPALRVSAAFGVGGVAFTVGNLIFARVLSAQNYGLLSLCIAIVIVSTQMAPLGLDLVIARRGLLLRADLRRAALAASTLTALVTAVVCVVLYDLRTSLWICVLIATVAGGVTQTAAAYFQNQGRFWIAVPVVQASNWILVPVAAITAVWGIEGATLPAAMMSAGAVLTALAGWAFVIRENPRDETRTNVPKLWGEALSLVTIMTAGSVFLQLERLVIPFVLGIEELARFGVLAALVGSPFRMIQAAVMFTVVPAMREAKTVVDRRRLLQRELLMAASVTACISIVMWPAVPYLAHWLLAGRYDLSAALMGATLVSGALKVLSAFSTATATALAPEKGLRLLSVGCWASLGVATLGGLAGASWGLTGVIYGICIGWIARWLIATWISIPHLRHSTDATSCV